MTDSHAFHLNLLKIAYNNLMQQDTFKGDKADPVNLEFLDQFAELVEAYDTHQPAAFDLGQDLMVRFVRVYPQYVHLVARDLFWLFGGECLHFMSDEEIQQFQQLDEALAEAEAQHGEIDYLQLRQAIFEPGSDTRH
ncbi:PA2817 family protein [Marinobacterium sediminicola]|uniref:Dehydrogenase n=1 Tax=Marinobacterium sediminicola TaxID=518898 RepID=A0ABY1S0V9_9GAMM|nr:PA2817 family protein [Marinobacterium sediminicola]ULG68360.1 hypothetical protein LN244_11675 [Marinobacterium sediminicola]SMR74761.1 hypothetical protein SAMN04487964_10866 [Marinobacterium sediminicola]